MSTDNVVTCCGACTWDGSEWRSQVGEHLGQEWICDGCGAYLREGGAVHHHPMSSHSRDAVAAADLRARQIRPELARVIAELRERGEARWPEGDFCNPDANEWWELFRAALAADGTTLSDPADYGGNEAPRAQERSTSLPG